MRQSSIGLLFAALAALAACRDTTHPAHLTHAMVGAYDVQASYTTHQMPPPGGGTSAVNASLTGTLIVSDTVEDRGQGNFFFPDVQMTAVFCSAPGSCSAPQSWTAFTSQFSPTDPVTFGFGGIIHLEEPFVNGGFSGTALYWVGADQRNMYSGTFIATKK